MSFIYPFDNLPPTFNKHLKNAERDNPSKKPYHVKNNFNHQTATRTNSYLFPVFEIHNGDLESITAWTGIVINLKRGIEGHVFDFDFVVD